MGVASYTDNAQNRCLSAMFGNRTFTPPPSSYFALTTEFNIFRNGSNVNNGAATEPSLSTSTYRRQGVANSLTNFSFPVNGAISGLTQITWPAPSSSWGDIYGMIIYDRFSAGTANFRFQYDSADPVVSGQNARRISVGNFIIRTSDMPGSLTHYAINQIHSQMFLNSGISPPANYFVGVSSTEITMSGTNITEPNGLNYARVSFANNTTNFGSGSRSYLTNINRITFPNPHGVWNPRWLFLSDQASAGNIYLKAPIPQAAFGMNTFSGGPPLIVESGVLYISL